MMKLDDSVGRFTGRLFRPVMERDVTHFYSSFFVGFFFKDSFGVKFKMLQNIYPLILNKDSDNSLFSKHSELFKEEGSRGNSMSVGSTGRLSTW